MTRPVRQPGELLALPTGWLAVTFLDVEGYERSQSFEVLAKHLLRDPDDPTVTYTLGPALVAAFYG